MTRVVGIVSAKGGVGKTTVAINLGAALTKHFNKKVALIDCNFTTSHVGLYLGMYNVPVTLNSVMRGESALSESLYAHASGLTIVPASLNLGDVHGLRDKSLARVIKDLSKSFDIILLDSAPGVGREALMTLKACDEILFVANPFTPSITDVTKCENLCNTELKNKEQIGVLLNRVEGKDYELSMGEIKSFTKLPILGVVPEDENILKSTHLKTPVIVSEPNSKSSKAFLKLAADLMGEDYVEYGLYKRIVDKWNFLGLRIKKAFKPLQSKRKKLRKPVKGKKFLRKFKRYLKKNIPEEFKK